MSSLEELVQNWKPAPLRSDDSMSVDPAVALAAVIDADASSMADGGRVPPMWHWLYFLSWPAHSELGPDGHPRSGQFMPPIPNRRRMVAGGSLDVLEPLRFGVPAARHSRVTRVATKRGSTGDLLFVTVRHEISQGSTLCLVEHHEVVYRQGGPPRSLDPIVISEEAPQSPEPWQSLLVPDPRMLFRFSALTANAHRIHYDEPYTRGIEGHPALVVHGPLLVIHMLELVRLNAPQATVSKLVYRLRSPVYCGAKVLAAGGPTLDGGALLSIATAHDPKHATAELVLR